MLCSGFTDVFDVAVYSVVSVMHYLIYFVCIICYAFTKLLYTDLSTHHHIIYVILPAEKNYRVVLEDLQEVITCC